METIQYRQQINVNKQLCLTLLEIHPKHPWERMLILPGWLVTDKLAASTLALLQKSIAEYSADSKFFTWSLNTFDASPFNITPSGTWLIYICTWAQIIGILSWKSPGPGPGPTDVEHHPQMPWPALPIPTPLEQSLSLIKKITCSWDITATFFLNTAPQSCYLMCCRIPA